MWRKGALHNVLYRIGYLYNRLMQGVKSLLMLYERREVRAQSSAEHGARRDGQRARSLV